MYPRLSRWTCAATAVAAIATVCFPNKLDAEQTMRTADGLIAISAEMPNEIRAGESFRYHVTVTNLSDNVVLHDIILRQRKAAGFSIESMSMANSQPANNQKTDRQKANSKKNQAGEKQAANNNKNDDRNEGKDQRASKKRQQESQKAQKENASESDSGKTQQRDQMRISSLQPGQSQVIQVRAAADQPGELRSCLEITDYKPSLCLVSQVVKPELQLTKNAPKKANRCDVIEIEYEVSNDGTGDVGAFTITDDLGDGLATIDGKQKLEFTVDELKAGDTRKFVARVYASKLGEFSSRAEARAKDADLQSRSAKTTTVVQAADLTVEIDSPGRLYGDEFARFTATIKNTGNAPAKSIQVRLMYPAQANLADVGDFQFTSSGNGEKANQQNQQTNNKSRQADNDQRQMNNASEQVEMADRELAIDRLEPGQAAQFEYVLRPGELDRLPTKVEALYVCAVDPAKDNDDARMKISSTANAEATIARLPALQIVAVDDEDPVSDGDKVTYTIRVWNEGDAVDNQVKVTAELPNGLEFVSANGPTDHKVNGSTIEFQPIEKLQPGDRHDFRITAKSSGNGNVQLKASMTSKSLSQKVTTEEPTRLFSRQASN